MGEEEADGGDEDDDEDVVDEEEEEEEENNAGRKACSDEEEEEEEENVSEILSCDETSKTDTSKLDETNGESRGGMSTESPSSLRKGPWRKATNGKEKLKICTDPSEIKPLLNGSSSQKGSEDSSSKNEGSENSDTNGSSQPSQLTSPTLCDLKNLKSGQYSALFETACEIEYYTSHKNILSPESSRVGKYVPRTRQRKKHDKLRDTIVKCHSASSSPIKLPEGSRQSVCSLGRMKTDAKPAGDPDGGKVGAEGCASVGKGGTGDILEGTEPEKADVLNGKTRQSLRRSSNNSLKKCAEGDTNKEGSFVESSPGGHSLSGSSDSTKQQIIETTC
ncbi:hypothetical protein RUM43_004185 [Polyplax serrata]|uniref:Uncharacterized protein n=1 Tax=Polyplax serrata TaxID=468196 RepID=A0AAN8XKT0_POLSC